MKVFLFTRAFAPLKILSFLPRNIGKVNKMFLKRYKCGLRDIKVLRIKKFMDKKGV